MINSVWNLCRTACPATPSDEKFLEHKRNFRNWSANDTSHSKDKDETTLLHKKDHIVIATQPKNHVFNRVLSSANNPGSAVLVTNPVTNLQSSNIGNSIPGSKPANDTLLGLGARKKKYPEFAYKNSDVLQGYPADSSRAKSEERHSGACELVSGGNTFRSRSAEPAKTMEVETRVPNTLAEAQLQYQRNPLMAQSYPAALETRATATEYKMAYSWPKNEAGRGADGSYPHGEDRNQVTNNSTKKSVTISNFNDLPPVKPPGHPQSIFNQEPRMVYKPVKPVKKTEYKAKFRPFSTYVYVSGNGWKKPKNVDRFLEGDKTKDWYNEVLERTQKANEFRHRSQLGHPISAGEHLEEIYKEVSGNLWVPSKENNRSLAALALATTKLKIEEKRLEKELDKNVNQSQGNKIQALISPQKEQLLVGPMGPRAKGTGSKSKPPPLPPKPSTQKSSEPDSDSGKIWLKPKKDLANGDISAAAPAENHESPQAEISPASGSDDQPKSPRPTTFPTSVTNGGLEFPSPSPQKEGPVKTTEIRSPEEYTGVKSPSPESWTVQMDTNSGLNWTDGKTPNIQSCSGPSSIPGALACSSAAKAAANEEEGPAPDDLYGPLSI